MGAAGVALAALGAHRPGASDLTTAAYFLLFHAAAVLGCTAASRETARPVAWLGAASVLVVGTLLFSADLGLIGLADARPAPLAAPIGGAGMIMGWLVVAVAAVLGEKRQQ